MNKAHKYDFLIVGAGLYGAVFAHVATSAGRRCLVIDRRGHIGGNVFCRQMHGINVHVYGAHIFHTDDAGIWRFVNSLVPFNDFVNSPLALAPDGLKYNLPFNMHTFRQLWGIETSEQATAIIEKQRRQAIDDMAAKGITQPLNLEQQALAMVGKDIYELLVKGYTEKQWGRPCDRLPAFIIKRLPVRMRYDNNYFDHKFQGIPTAGYTPLVQRLLDGSDVRLGCDFGTLRDTWRTMATTLVYTGTPDAFFDYCHGSLQWRTLRFEHQLLQTADFQHNAVVNYTDVAVPYTRIVEHKHFQPQDSAVQALPQTVVSREYPEEYRVGCEPYYPINTPENQKIAEAYLGMAAGIGNVVFGGRLATYRYLDMAPVIANAIADARREINK